MRDCECKGKNPNCAKCDGKGYVSDETNIFGANIKSSKKGIPKSSPKKKVAMPQKSGTLKKGYYFSEKGQVTKFGRPVFGKNHKRRGRKKKS